MPPVCVRACSSFAFQVPLPPPLNRFCRTNHSALCHSVVLRYRERNGYLFRGRTFSLRNVLLETGRKTKALGREEIVVSRLTPCLTNYFPENVPVLTVQFYSKSVHVLIKEKYIFFFCVVGGTRSGKCPQFEICKSWVLHRKFWRARHVIYAQGVKTRNWRCMWRRFIPGHICERLISVKVL